jgi:hypothetical protein
MRQPKAVTPVIPAPPHQSINYEEEEELYFVDLEVYSYDKKTCCALDYASGTSLLPQPAPVVFSSICI